MTTGIENVKTTNGRCHVDMTREQALEEGRKTAKLFAELNTDNDEVLSL